jgi:signal transduction histidine kinase
MLAGLRERSMLRADNARLIVDLQASRQRLVTAAVATRRRVERDLHDGAQQELVIARVAARKLRAQIAASDQDTAGVEQLERHLERAIEELRYLAHGVYPAQLDAEGLPAALTEVAARSTIPCSVTYADIPRSGSEVESAVYFSCIEALQNAGKHAGAGATTRIELSVVAGSLTFAVVDNGCGFSVGTLRPNSGLQNIVDRIGAVGGEVAIDSALGRGTRVSGRIPLMAAPA